jgi:hypothetical protein
MPCQATIAMHHLGATTELDFSGSVPVLQGPLAGLLELVVYVMRNWGRGFSDHQRLGVNRLHEMGGAQSVKGAAGNGEHRR